MLKESATGEIVILRKIQNDIHQDGLEQLASGAIMHDKMKRSFKVVIKITLKKFRKWEEAIRLVKETI